MKTLLVVNSYVINKNYKRYVDNFEGKIIDYQELIKLIKFSAEDAYDLTVDDTLFFISYISGDRSTSMKSFTEIELKANSHLAPLNRVDIKCNTCEAEFKKIEEDIYNTTVASETIHAVMAGGFDSVIFLGLDITNTPILKTLRKMFKTVLVYTFSNIYQTGKGENLSIKANVSYDVELLDELIGEFTIDGKHKIKSIDS